MEIEGGGNIIRLLTTKAWSKQTKEYHQAQHGSLLPEDILDIDIDDQAEHKKIDKASLQKVIVAAERRRQPMRAKFAASVTLDQST